MTFQLTSKPLDGTDAHQTTLSIFHVLSIYGWDAKLVLALAAFSLIYGEFWLLAQIYSTNQLAKPMAMLRQVPGIMEHATQLKTRLKALNDLIKTILDVARCAIEIRELQSMYTTHESPHFAAVKNTFIPTAIYWTVRSMVACAAQITSFSSMGYEYVFLSIPITDFFFFFYFIYIKSFSQFQITPSKFVSLFPTPNLFYMIFY
jgi:hypothetical protein